MRVVSNAARCHTMGISKKERKQKTSTTPISQYVECDAVKPLIGLLLLRLTIKYVSNQSLIIIYTHSVEPAGRQITSTMLSFQYSPVQVTDIC